MRCAWFWLVGTGVTILVDLKLLLARLAAPRLIWRINAFWGRAVLWGAGVRLTVEGAAHARGGPFMIVANHSSMLDIVAGFAGLPTDFRYVSRPFFFRVPLLGWGMFLGGHVSLDPRKPRQAARALRRAGARFRKGQSLLMYPEGTRSPDGGIAAYKRGPFLTAIQNGVPILPVRLVDLHRALPKGRLCPRPGPARLIIGEPVPTAGLGPPDAKHLARRVEEWTRAAAR